MGEWRLVAWLLGFLGLLFFVDDVSMPYIHLGVSWGFIQVLLIIYYLLLLLLASVGVFLSLNITHGCACRVVVCC